MPYMFFISIEHYLNFLHIYIYALYNVGVLRFIWPKYYASMMKSITAADRHGLVMIAILSFINS